MSQLNSTYSKGPTRDDDQIWIAMELCAGGSVTDLLESMKKWHEFQSLNEEEIAYILSEVCNALVYLHGHCRIHRDVKGNNILLTEEGKKRRNQARKQMSSTNLRFASPCENEVVYFSKSQVNCSIQ